MIQLIFLNVCFQLYHIEPGLRPVLIRDTPEEKTMELCRYSSTNRCNRGLECYFAHRYDQSFQYLTSVKF